MSESTPGSVDGARLITPIERHYVSAAIQRYCPADTSPVWSLPVLPAARSTAEPLPPRLTQVELPAWASDIGVDGYLAVPAHLVMAGEGPAWRRAAWFSAITWYMHGSAERAFEAANGPVHSFAFRLQGWPVEMWERPWVNRIVLFLRRWAAQQAASDETAMFGPVPEARIHITHDVDYLAKGFDFRLKQSIHFARAVLSRFSPGAGERGRPPLDGALRKIFMGGDYNTLPALRDLERRHDVRSTIHFFAARGSNRSLAATFADPRYAIDAPWLRDVMAKLRDGGWEIGLHQSYDAWQNGNMIAEERARLEKASGARVSHCRQHWLRFAWRDTWRAQEAAGFEYDATLGFNDLAGFRTASAVAVSPWDPARDRAMSIVSRPFIAMDAHANHFPGGDDSIRRFVAETRAVGGEATIAWHPHTLHPDFRNNPGYEDYLNDV